MPLTPDAIYQHFIVKRTQVEMLKDRGYLIPEDEEDLFLADDSKGKLSSTILTDFVRHYTSQDDATFSRENMSTIYQDENGNKTYVYFVPQTAKERQGVGVVQSFVEKLTNQGINLGILITIEDFTSDAKKAIADITTPSIQVFFDRQLFTNPTLHKTTPPHYRLTPDERLKFLSENKIQPGQMPSFTLDEPIVRYYNWKPGDIIRIERFNIATDKIMVTRSIAYRIVSKNVSITTKKSTKASKEKST